MVVWQKSYQVNIYTKNRPKLGLVLHVYHTVSPPQGFTHKSKCTGLIENKREMLRFHGCIQHLHIASGICLYIYLCAYTFLNLFRGLTGLQCIFWSVFSETLLTWALNHIWLIRSSSLPSLNNVMSVPSLDPNYIRPLIYPFFLQPAKLNFSGTSKLHSLMINCFIRFCQCYYVV